MIYELILYFYYYENIFIIIIFVFFLCCVWKKMGRPPVGPYIGDYAFQWDRTEWWCTKLTPFIILFVRYLSSCGFINFILREKKIFFWGGKTCQYYISNRCFELTARLSCQFYRVSCHVILHVISQTPLHSSSRLKMMELHHLFDNLYTFILSVTGRNTSAKSLLGQCIKQGKHFVYKSFSQNDKKKYLALFIFNSTWHLRHFHS